MSKGISGFALGDGGIGVAERGRWDQDGASGWKFNDELEVPKNEVPSQRRVEVAKGGDGAPPKRKVSRIPVIQAACLGPEVECRAGEDAVLEVAGQAAVAVVQSFVVLRVVRPELGRPGSEARCRR